MSRKKDRVHLMPTSNKTRRKRVRSIKRRGMPKDLRRCINKEIHKAADIIDTKRDLYGIPQNTLWLNIAKLISRSAREIVKQYPLWNYDLTDACEELERRKKGKYTVRIKR